MADNVYRGDAKDVSQVQTFTITGNDVTTTYKVTMNGKVISVIGNAGGASDTATDLKTALAATSISEFYEAVWTVGTATITATARTAGIPFTFTVSVSGGAGTIGSIATTTSSSGKWHIDDATNWTRGNLPQHTCIAPVQSAAAAAAGGSLTNGTTYYWVVTATNSNGETVVSNERSLAIVTPNLTATLAWAAVTGATGYKVYRSTAAGTYGATSLVTTISSGSTLTYNDTGTALTSGTPPVSSTALADVVYFQNCTVDARYGLTALAAVTPDKVYIDASYTGSIGLSDYNSNGNYREYRQRALQFNGCTNGVFIGKGNGSGSGQVRLDFQSTVAANISVEGTGSPSSQNVKALMLQGSHASNQLNTTKGSIGLATQAGETANFPTIRVGSEQSVTNDVDMYIGAGCSTVTTLTQNGGRIVSEASITTHVKTAGDFAILGTATPGTVTNDGGIYDWRSSGTMTAGTFRGDSSKLDCSHDPRTKTATALTVTNGATLHDPLKVLTSLAYTTDAKSLAKANLGNAPYTLTRS